MGKVEATTKIWHICDDCLDPIFKLLEQYATGKGCPGSVDPPSGQDLSNLLEESRFNYAIAWMKANISADLGTQMSEMVNQSMREMKLEIYKPATKIRLEQLRALVEAVRAKKRDG
jgi:hypothetical protein